MKYIIKCPYCGTTYTVDVEQQKQTFMCNSCGGQNSIEDAIERVEEAVTREQLLSEEEARRLRLRKIWEKEDAKRAEENENADVFTSSGARDLEENFTSMIPVLGVIFIVLALIWGTAISEQDKQRAQKEEQKQKEKMQEILKDNRWFCTLDYTVNDMITIEIPYYINQTDEENVFVTNDEKVTYRVESIFALGNRTPQEVYEEQLGIYKKQRELLFYSVEVKSIKMNDYSEGYVGSIDTREGERRFDYEVLILPHKNLVVILSMEYATDHVPEDDVSRFVRGVEGLMGRDDAVMGKVLTEADGSTLVLSGYGTYTYYQFKDVTTDICTSGSYDVYYGMEAMFELASMTNYEFTEEALEKDVYENMKGYVLNGEAMENGETYHICTDSFYVLILHQNQVTEGENITDQQEDIVYSGYYVWELKSLDMTNADTAECVRFEISGDTMKTCNIYDKEWQVETIYLNSNKEVRCGENNPYQRKLLLQLELVTQKETIGASGFEFTRVFGFTTSDGAEVEFLQNATEGVYRIHIANSDGSQTDYYYEEDEDVTNLCKLVNKALEYERKTYDKTNL